MGNGVAMATERSTHDVKAQRGLGRGRGGKGKREKSVCATATVFSSEMRTGLNAEEQGLLAAPVSSYDIRQAACTPRRNNRLHAALALHGAPRNKCPQSSTPLERQSVSSFRLAQPFANSTKRHVVSVNVKANKDGSNLRGDVSI